MSSRYNVIVRDVYSRPMIRTTDGKVLSIGQLRNGRWESYDEEEADCALLVAASDLVMAAEAFTLKYQETVRADDLYAITVTGTELLALRDALKKAKGG